ncbi:MAG: 4-hydroxythreonine-4-phosphate dehydrogenase PdxA [Spirochaetes bacterium]|jgi:4-hydroxythreonine-4-phosphate dehydrogenase|nr:4-hydroxythreonine-4-phosphate dehydrogenase PdxA [Spirochaetota bacterium]
MNSSKLEREHKLIGITIGDPSGIGPEVSLRAVDSLPSADYPTVLIGRLPVLQYYHSNLPLNKRIFIASEHHLSSPESIPPETIPVFDVPEDYNLPKPGLGSKHTGRESLDYIDTAVTLWKKSLISAIVTAPVSKQLIEESGTPFTGHTEYFADSIEEKDPYMMMYSEKYTVILVTTHEPLANVHSSVTEDKIRNTVLTAYKGMKRIKRREPRIAICGLDPHCGDGGAIGNFDTQITAPLVTELHNSGININGPFASDTLFIPSEWEKYDIIVAHYHDQGLIPFKMLAFDTGVNVTLGLSLVRTSVDHGTAFNIAGKGVASYSSMIEAITLCKSLQQS